MHKKTIILSSLLSATSLQASENLFQYLPHELETGDQASQRIQMMNEIEFIRYIQSLNEHQKQYLINKLLEDDNETIQYINNSDLHSIDYLQSYGRFDFDK